MAIIKMKSNIILLMCTVLGNCALTPYFGEYTYMDSEGPNNWTARRRTRLLDGIQPPHLKDTTVTGPPQYQGIPPIVAPNEQDTVPNFNCFMVVRANPNGQCACVLVGVNFVLTSGRCGYKDFDNRIKYWPEEIFIRVIEVIYARINSMSLVDIAVLDIQIHRTIHSTLEWEHNVAAVYMRRNIVPSQYLGIAKLPKRNVLYNPQIQYYWTLSSLRFRHDAIDFADSMWLIKTQYVKMDLCREVYTYYNLTDTYSVTCAAYYHEGSAYPSCVGDHGTGLSFNGTLIGLLARTAYSTCGAPQHATVFTNVGFNINWIQEALKTFQKKHKNVKIPNVA